MNPLLALCCMLALATIGCSTPDLAPVVGRIGSARLGPTTATILTTPQPGGGVEISTDIGQGRRAVKLKAADTGRLIATLERTLDDWSDRDDGPPYRETLMGAVVTSSRTNPLVVEIVRAPGMDEPVFMLTVGYFDTPAVLALDKDNAKMWSRTLRAAGGYPY